MASANIANTLRRSLLIKLISKPAPSREDVNSVIELTATKVVEALQAQSMTLYLIEGNDIVFKHVYYSPPSGPRTRRWKKSCRRPPPSCSPSSCPSAPAWSAR